LKKILLTGSTGLFGSAFNKFNENKFTIYNHIHIKINKFLKKKFLLNLNSLREVDNFVKKNKIEIIIHAAALTDVDYCEKNKKAAYLTNVNITLVLLKVCKKYNVKLIFLSTDQLFNGKRKVYSEKSKYTPVNYYSSTKVLSEIKIKKNYKNYIIIRTNFFGYGFKERKSFSDFILNSISKKRNVYLFNDVKFNPVYLKSLVIIINKMIFENLRGTFNVSSDQCLSKYEFGIRLAKRFNLSANYIQKSKIEKFTNLVTRPKNMFLNNSKIKKKLKIKKICINSEIKKFYNDKYLFN
jgi:dTDP-4-dehydrorhamnose reductase